MRAKEEWKQEFDAFVAILGGEDNWFTFKAKARDFIALYEAVSPDPVVLDYTDDLKWVATFLQYATQVFEKKEAFEQQGYSQKIREMLATHLEATGLSVTVKLRHITDPGFWDDFQTDGKTDADLKTAAIRKTTELRKTVTERIDAKPHQYGKFSERLKELLEKLDNAQLSWAEMLSGAEKLAKEIAAEDQAHESSGLSAGAYGILQVLQTFGAGDGADALAVKIEALYTGSDTAPPGWPDKDGMQKGLRQAVGGLAHEFGLGSLREIAEQVEAFALKHFAKA
jgi:type I restriction enzyme, R subunit